MQALRDCMEEPTIEGGRQKFVTRVGGRRVCNGCFAVATGYSQRRLKALKADIRERGRFSATHGNTHQTREHTHISATRAVSRELFQRSWVYTTTSASCTEEGPDHAPTCVATNEYDSPRRLQHGER